MRLATKRLVLIPVILLMLAGLILAGCAAPAPVPAPPPAPAPTPPPAPAPAPPAPAPAPPAPAPAPPAPAPAIPPKPDMFVWSDMEIGSSAHTQYVALGEGIRETFGIKVRALPFPATMAAVMATKTGVAQTFTTNPGMWYAQEGMYEYGVREQGPQPVRMVYQARRRAGAGPLTTLKSGIKTMADLKGKKVVNYLGSPGMQTYVNNGLAFAGLTWDDVIKVDVSGLGEAKDALLTGKVDMIMYATNSGGAYEIASAPCGLYWIPFPKDDVEGWKRVKELCPSFGPILCEFGANLSKEHPVEFITSAYPILCAFDWLDEADAYWMAKAIVESYDAYKDIMEEMTWWTLDDCLVKSPHAIPWHEGVVRYFKEVGAWTDEYEQLQREHLARQEELKKVWDAACEEADNLGIKAKEWADFWEKKRVEASK